MPRSIRWIPAAAIAAAVVTIGAVAVPLSADAAVSLSPKSPQQVLALIAGSTTDSFSGTVKTSSDLGLPSLPSVSGGSGGSGSDSADSSLSTALTLLSTSQTARVFVDGPTKARVQVLSNIAEKDLVRNGADVWVYDSKKNTAVHTTLPSRTGATPAPTGTTTPAELGRAIVSKLDGSTALSVGTNASVAGRSAYTLVLKPKATDTLIGSLSIAVDAKTGLPLDVKAMARGQKDPAFEVGFSALTLAAPSASTFAFTPPKNAKVTDTALPTHRVRPDVTTPRPAAAKPTVVGSGWDAVIVSPANSELTKLSSVKQFSQLTTAVAGGRVFHTTLLNVLITTDGRVVVGSVPTARLQAVAQAQ